MKLRVDGKPDKRYKKDPLAEPVEMETAVINVDRVVGGLPKVDVDPNEFHAQLLKDNNLKLDFDVLEGTIPTKFGVIKLLKPTLVIKASYEPTK